MSWNTVQLNIYNPAVFGSSDMFNWTSFLKNVHFNWMVEKLMNIILGIPCWEINKFFSSICRRPSSSSASSMRGRSQSVIVNNPMLVRTAPSTPSREGRPRPSSPTSKRPPSLGGSGPPNKTPRFGFFEKEILSFPQIFVSREIQRQKEAEQFCKTSILGW